MSRIFLMGAQRLYVDVGRELVRRGIDPVLIYVTDHSGFPEAFRAAFPQATLLPAFPLYGANLPVGLKVDLQPAQTEDIEALAPWEGAVLQMMDRRNFDGLAAHDVRHMYLRYIAMWRALLEHFKPDAVHFHLTPHQGHDFVLYLLCRRLGIPTIIVEATYLKQRLFIRRAIEDVPRPSAEELSRKLLEFGGAPPPLETAQQHTIAKQLVDPLDIEKNLSIRRQLAELLKPAVLTRALKPSYDNAFGLTQRRPPQALYRIYELWGRIGVRETYRFYQQRAKRSRLSEPFVYLPLHYQPEKTTLPDGLRFTDQLHIAEVLAASLPAGWKLYVKEHARQFNLSYGLRGTTWSKGRSMHFYRRLAALRGVELVDLDVPSADLAASSRAVATVTGTSGWEALQMGKPVLVFGSAWFSSCPGVYRIRDTAEVGPALRHIAASAGHVDTAAVLAWAHAMQSPRNTFRGVHWDPLVEKTDMTPEEHARSYADALEAAVRDAHIGVKAS
ncbi:MAG: hypothetical protein JNK82_39060 [Myxococcaceae bacterium]|nr:hypothetical protein [Myxococcaceae bacterium]